MTELTCPTSGTLRTHLDHPDPNLEAHLDDCDACRALTLTVAGDAGTVSRLLGLLDAGPGPGGITHAEGVAAVAPPSSRSSDHGADMSPTGATSRLPRRRHLVGVGGVLLAAILAVTPFGRTAVAQFVDTFRVERVQVVELDLDAVMGAGDLSGLADFATVTMPEEAEGPAPVATVQDAVAIAGIAPPDLVGVDLGSGPVTAEQVSFVASAPGQATVTLHTTPENGVPADLDGARLIVAVPGVAAAVVGAGAGIPDLIAGIAGTLEVSAENASLEDIRAFLLGRDELPESLRTQLAAIEDWRHTLPLPVPTDGIGWEAVIVNGSDGIAFGDSSGLGAAVLWQSPEGIGGVAGPQGVDELLAVADAIAR